MSIQCIGIFSAYRLTEKVDTIRLDLSTIEYFKKLARETGFSYQSLINLYLRDCAKNHKKLKIEWVESSY
jgi:predicted DNA binding CopG/RHH family protein